MECVWFAVVFIPHYQLSKLAIEGYSWKSQKEKETEEVTEGIITMSSSNILKSCTEEVENVAAVVQAGGLSLAVVMVLLFSVHSELLQDLDMCDNDPVAVARCFVMKVRTKAILGRG